MVKYFIPIILLLSFWSCKTQTVYVPVETMKVEYRDRIVRDSIFTQDSVFIHSKGDTVWYERYKTIYQDKIRLDSVYLVDSIRVPYPVVELQEVNRLTNFQAFQIWCGRIILLIIASYFVVCVIRKLL